MSDPNVTSYSAQQLQEYLSTLHDRLATLEANRAHNGISTAPSAPASSGLPKVSMPDKFDGNIHKFRDFLISVENIFVLHASRYPTAEIKIRFIGTLLEKDPLSWFRSLLEESKESIENLKLLTDYDHFIATFKELYDDPHAQRHAQSTIKRLKQGKGSVLTYSARFRRLSVDTGFNKNALIDLFRDGLSDDVKDVLASCLEEPTDFEEFIRFCVKIDNRLFDRRLEKSSTSKNRDSAPNLISKTGHGDTRNGYRAIKASSGSGPGPSPMDLDSMQTHHKLTKDEKQRRLVNNLCLYCGNAGHKVSNCDKKPKN